MCSVSYFKCFVDLNSTLEWTYKIRQYKKKTKVKLSLKASKFSFPETYDTYQHKLMCYI